MTDKERERGIYKVTLVGSVVNFSLIVFKFTAGIIGNSAAMIADAVHSLSDFATDIVVLVFVRISNKPKDKSHDYGHNKFETFATLIIGIVLLIVGLGIAWSGAEKIISVMRGAKLQTPGMIAFYAAIISIVSKEILYRYTVIRSRKLKSDAMNANAWHQRSDALSSMGTAAGVGGAILLGEKWTILDPIAALAVSFFIVKVAFQLIKPCVDELMEKSLSDEIENEIIAIVESFDGVSNLHNLHTRKFGNSYAIEFHIRMRGEMLLSETHEKNTQIEKRLKERYGTKTHVIIHTEPVIDNDKK